MTRKIKTLVIIMAIVSLGFNLPLKNTEAFCENPLGFVTAGLSITDLTSGSSGGGFNTSGFPGGSTSMNYTPGGDLYIEVTAGANGQQDEPANWVLQISGTSTEGNYFSGTDYGNNVPSFTVTLHNVYTSSINLSVTQCAGDTANTDINLNELNASPSFTTYCDPGSQTTTAGVNKQVYIDTTASNGFASPVTFTASVSPTAGTEPTVTFNNNGLTPNATTTATITTTGSTTPGTYTIQFTGTGGGVTQNCTSQIVVNGLPPSFTLSVAPSGAQVEKNNNATYTVTANCGGSFAGPVHSLSASSSFTGLTYTFSPTTIACGDTSTLTVGNTGAIPTNQLSNAQTTLTQTLTVTGWGD